MKVIVSGSRNATFDQYSVVKAALDSIKNIDLIIHGGCRGIDAMAESYGKFRHVKTKVVEADWDTFGSSAGPIRNKEMLKMGDPKVDIVVAFPSPDSKGTVHLMDFATSMGYKVIEVPLPE